MKSAAFLGAFSLFLLTVVANGGIPTYTGPHARTTDTGNLRQFLSQLVAETPHPMAGRGAPDFTAETLDGTRVGLSEHTGKHVVVLDFWATWCPPCRAAMPIFEGVAEQYKGRSVAFYAINQGETRSAVRRFLERNELDLNVLMDPEQDIGAKYGVDGIPHTVIIGKDGTIQAVHSGFSSDMETRLKTELDTLLDGRSLVAPRA